jgi:hypothetical protein
MSFASSVICDIGSIGLLQLKKVLPLAEKYGEIGITD